MIFLSGSENALVNDKMKNKLSKTLNRKKVRSTPGEKLYKFKFATSLFSVNLKIMLVRKKKLRSITFAYTAFNKSEEKEYDTLHFWSS